MPRSFYLSVPHLPLELFPQDRSSPPLQPTESRFAGGLTQEEVRGAVLLGLIGFVIYPILPNRFVDPWNILNPREAWLTVILIASIGFLNYVLLRLYSARRLYYTAIFGGLGKQYRGHRSTHQAAGHRPTECPADGNRGQPADDCVHVRL